MGSGWVVLEISQSALCAAATDLIPIQTDNDTSEHSAKPPPAYTISTQLHHVRKSGAETLQATCSSYNQSNNLLQQNF
jgi:hypothetical protein